MARAVGGSVTRNPVKEIGWAPVCTTEAAAARDWFGDLAAGKPLFHWHGETFSLPEGATRILQSDHCANQAFVYDDRHLAMQCHVEMTPDLIAAWCTHGAGEIATSRGPRCKRPQPCRRTWQNARNACTSWPTASIRAGLAASNPDDDASRGGEAPPGDPGVRCQTEHSECPR